MLEKRIKPFVAFFFSARAFWRHHRHHKWRVWGNHRKLVSDPSFCGHLRGFCFENEAPASFSHKSPIQRSGDQTTHTPNTRCVCNTHFEGPAKNFKIDSFTCREAEAGVQKSRVHFSVPTFFRSPLYWCLVTLWSQQVRYANTHTHTQGHAFLSLWGMCLHRYIMRSSLVLILLPLKNMI